MSLKLMYITNNPDIALLAESSGVDMIFVDMEYIGKDIRQKGLDSVKNHHTVEDVKNIRKVLTKAKLLVRVNPIHDKSDTYSSSEEEIESVINAGADIIMLPYFKNKEEVSRFVSIVKGRCKTLLLIETSDAVNNLEDILSVKGIDSVHIGLNDLSIDMNKKFMFEILADGTVDNIVQTIKKHHIPFGIGGIASLGNGIIPSEFIIMEHYRLGSSAAILSRSFCNTTEISDIKEIEKVFLDGVKAIRAYESFCLANPEEYENNHNQLKDKVEEYVTTI